jgi:hypothetical protein
MKMHAEKRGEHPNPLTRFALLNRGKDAFHRVPDLAGNEWDAVERVLTIPQKYSDESMIDRRPSIRPECSIRLFAS